MKKEVIYKESDNYFPKKILKEFKMGKYSEEAKNERRNILKFFRKNKE